MSDQPSTTTVLVTAEAPLFDDARLAVASFLARSSGPTRASYMTDLRSYFARCTRHDLSVFAAKRGHLELWARTTRSPPTWPGRRRSFAGRSRWSYAGSRRSTTPSRSPRRRPLAVGVLRADLRDTSRHAPSG
jgi:hypothetical protein